MRKRKHQKPGADTREPDALPAKAADPTKFRERSHEISRIEGFSDAVFAFATTLMVVSLEVPHTYGELMHAMHGFFAFAACFASFFMIWYYQHLFFRRYGLQDEITLVLNAILIFVVLFYVYPLKFLFGLLFDQLMGNRMAFAEAFAGFKITDVSTLMVVYSAGYLAVFAVFALLQLHAYRKRQQLGLNELECYDTLMGMRSYLINVAFAVVSILIALSPIQSAAFFAGMVYALIGPAFWAFGSVVRRRRRTLEQRALSERA